MASITTVPINFGRRDRTAAKFAPFGTLKSAKNMRHREQGGLGMRNGYSAVPMTTRTGTLVAYDLHEYQGRLCALGSDVGEGFPADIFEFTDSAAERWRASGGTITTINPFTNAREVAGIPQAEGGVARADAASGGGYACIVYRAASSGKTYAVIVDSATNQTIGSQNLTDTLLGLCALERVAFAGGKFFVAAARGDNSVRIVQFTPGLSTAWSLFVDADGADAGAVSALDLVPVQRASTALLAIGFDRGNVTELSLKIYRADATQLGSTINVGSTNTLDLWLDADQTDDTIVLYTVQTVSGNRLRTFNFSGSLVAGPTTTTSGPTGTLCRRTSGVGADLAFVGANTASGDFVIQSINVDTHAITGESTIFQFVQKTRLLGAQSGNDPNQLVVGGIVGIDAVTNALLYLTSSTIHMTTRDFLQGVAHDPTTLTRDATTGQICWLSVHSPGVASLGVPAVTLLDFKSRRRIQAVNYGGLRYFAGATPFVYDGRVITESCWNEAPGIISLTPSDEGGALTASARYTYQVHWEFTFADGSFIESPPSQLKTVTLGAGDNRVTAVATTPHSLRVSLGPAFGMSATLVLSRTEWSPDTIDVATGLPGAQFSILRRAQQVAIDAEITSYGATVSIVDQLADAGLADEEPIYTQAERGAFSGSLEHNAPESCSFITATESRLFSGGLVRPFEVQVSKEAFIGQPFAYSELANFLGQVSERVRGVHALDGVKLVFTEGDIYGLGEGAPDDEGKGVLGQPIRVPTLSGLKDWRSLLEGPDGLWFQLDDDKLFRMPRGGGSPEWMGVDIYRLVRDFPVVTAAARHRADNAGLFALNDTALTSARVAVRDFLLESWLVDEPPLQAGHGIEALTVYGRTVAYCSGGVVYRQGAGFADNGSTFIACQLVTQPIYPFGLGGYGLIHDVLVTAEWRGACTLSLRVSYDDGVSFEAMPTAFTLSGLTPGATVRRKWTLRRNVTASILIELNVGTAGSATEGLVINQIDLLVEHEPGLPELLPAEQS